MALGSQIEFFDETQEYRNKLNEALPGTMAAENAFLNEVYKDGKLSRKVKRLMAMAIALRAGCDRCIVGQTKLAIEAGATRDEVMEALSVAIAMGGTPAMGWSWRVLKVLEEQGR
ncbi:carboxymuconolactone decarboxylase family protein [Chloroflexota bacterium]|jgi:AhpD family alkylhydroperoxidase